MFILVSGATVIISEQTDRLSITCRQYFRCQEECLKSFDGLVAAAFRDQGLLGNNTVTQ